MTVGERIKQRREQQGLTQTELGDAVGTTKQNIYKYETGMITNIPIERLEDIAEALHMKPGELCGWEEENRDPAHGEVSDAKRTLLEMVDRMSDEDVDKMLRLIAVMFPET